jgi:hypothetical protein
MNRLWSSLVTSHVQDNPEERIWHLLRENLKSQYKTTEIAVPVVAISG